MTALACAVTSVGVAAGEGSALAGPFVKEASFTAGVSNGWASVERYRVNNPGFTA